MTDPVQPDPGNAPPEGWSEPLDEQTKADVIAAVNQTSVETPYREEGEHVDDSV